MVDFPHLGYYNILWQNSQRLGLGLPVLLITPGSVDRRRSRCVSVGWFAMFRGRISGAKLSDEAPRRIKPRGEKRPAGNENGFDHLLKRGGEKKWWEAFPSWVMVGGGGLRWQIPACGRPVPYRTAVTLSLSVAGGSCVR